LADGRPDPAERQKAPADGRPDPAESLKTLADGRPDPAESRISAAKDLLDQVDQAESQKSAADDRPSPAESRFEAAAAIFELSESRNETTAAQPAPTEKRSGPTDGVDGQRWRPAVSDRPTEAAETVCAPEPPAASARPTWFDLAASAPEARKPAVLGLAVHRRRPRELSGPETAARALDAGQAAPAQAACAGVRPAASERS
jgi:hypothetical protein